MSWFVVLAVRVAKIAEEAIFALHKVLLELLTKSALRYREDQALALGVVYRNFSRPLLRGSTRTQGALKSVGNTKSELIPCLKVHPGGDISGNLRYTEVYREPR